MYNNISIRLILIFVLTSLQVFSQNEFSKWYFGLQAGLDFSTSPPTILTNGIVNTAEGVATMCDSNGNLLFYTDGTFIANSQHTIMANGNGLYGNGTMTQAGIIVKQPGNANIYYVFHLNTLASSPGHFYSVVDMNLAAGLGSVTVKNATLYTPTSEKQVAIRHCNGRDVWIVSHEYNSNNFRSYLLTSAGVNTVPVISSIGGSLIGTGASTLGHLKISRDGRKLAMATWSNSVPASSGLSGFYLFDFDAATGVVSNSITLSNDNFPYGVEFSPDGTKLYATTQPTGSTQQATIYQWNICAQSQTAIIASQYTFNIPSPSAGSLQWAIDGKIYLAVTAQQSLSVINNPNGSGAAMGFSYNAISVAPKTSAIGLPNYINLYTKPAATPFTSTIACQNASFNVPPVPNFSSGCSSTPYAPNGYYWNFGEPGSGSNNTSTLTSPTHLYGAIGTYTASLILINPCGNDTLKQVVTIVTPGPTPAVSGSTAICKGDRYTYTASGGSTFLWSSNTGGATNSTVSLSPTTTTSYTLNATSNGCTLAKVFTITVNPCLGLGTNNNDQLVRLFPNPFGQTLTIEAMTYSDYEITDLNGKVILKGILDVGQNQISTAGLNEGFYFVSIRTGDLKQNSVWRGKLLKLE